MYAGLGETKAKRVQWSVVSGWSCSDKEAGDILYTHRSSEISFNSMRRSREMMLQDAHRRPMAVINGMLANQDLC